MKPRHIRITLILLLAAVATFELDRMYVRPGRLLRVVEERFDQDKRRAEMQASRPARLYLGDSIVLEMKEELESDDNSVVWALPGEFGVNLPMWFERIRSASPDTLVVNLGVNDLLSGQSIGKLLLRYQELFSLCDSIHCEVLLPGVLQPELEWSPYVRPGSLRSRTLELNDQLSKAAALEHVQYLEFPDRFPPAGYTRDGIHLNQEGKAFWQRYLNLAIRELNQREELH